MNSARVTDGTEQPKRHTPPASLLLAYAAMAPILAGAVVSLVAGAGWRALVVRLTIAWAGAVVCFLAGVRRGLSFRQPGGSTVAEVATMFALFVLGALSLLSPWQWLSLTLQLAAFVALAIVDPLAARHGEAPAFFARLRPAQMLVPVGGLLVMLARVAL